MLVLTRKTKQQIQVGENIVITILQVRGQAVRVGIEAPRDVRVVRGELAAEADHTAEADHAADEITAGKSSMPRPERIDAGCGASDPGFSSPLVGCVSIVGESSGLYPFVRRQRLDRGTEHCST